MRLKPLKIIAWVLAGVVGFGVGLVIAALLLISWISFTLPALPPLEVLVDPSLLQDGAWPVGRTSIPDERWVEASIEIEATRSDQDRVEVRVKRQWSEYGHDLQFRIMYLPDAPPEISVTWKGYDVTSGANWAMPEVGGIVRVNSDRPVWDDGRDMILSYELVSEGSSGAEPMMPGKLVLRAEDLR